MCRNDPETRISGVSRLLRICFKPTLWQKLDCLLPRTAKNRILFPVAGKTFRFLNSGRGASALFQQPALRLRSFRNRLVEPNDPNLGVKVTAPVSREPTRPIQAIARSLRNAELTRTEAADRPSCVNALFSPNCMACAGRATPSETNVQARIRPNIKFDLSTLIELDFRPSTTALQSILCELLPNSWTVFGLI